MGESAKIKAFRGMGDEPLSIFRLHGRLGNCEKSGFTLFT